MLRAAFEAATAAAAPPADPSLNINPLPRAAHAAAEAGDVAIILERAGTASVATLTPGADVHNKFGRFLLDDLLGHPLGRRWLATTRPGAAPVTGCGGGGGGGGGGSGGDAVGGGGAADGNGGGSGDGGGGGGKRPAGRRVGSGFVFALRPSPTLWPSSLLHRTQVVYPHDAALIELKLELAPGAVVVEAGTGSGGLTVPLAAAVAPSGRVHTYDFHAGRSAAAAADFEALGVAPVIDAHGGVDVAAEGFVGVADGAADAVFLDLPDPAGILSEAGRVLAPDGRLCCFSPCIEQVARTVAVMAAAPGVWHSVETLTCTLRVWETYEAELQSLEETLDVSVTNSGSGRLKRQRREAAAAAAAAATTMVATTGAGMVPGEEGQQGGRTPSTVAAAAANGMSPGPGAGAPAVVGGKEGASRQEGGPAQAGVPVPPTPDGASTAAIDSAAATAATDSAAAADGGGSGTVSPPTARAPVAAVGDGVAKAPPLPLPSDDVAGRRCTRRPHPPTPVGGDGSTMGGLASDKPASLPEPGPVLCKPQPNVKGHTSYLTFARRCNPE
ncbi:hypothetical protein MMPV_001968 [Pyropia vietnamensis]